MQRFGLLALFAALACEPAPPDTSTGSASGEPMTGGQSESTVHATTSSGEADTTHGGPASSEAAGTSDDDTTSGGSASGGGTDAPTEEPTEEAPECGCTRTTPTFCAAVVALCEAKGLDFSPQEGPDFCAAYAKWCANGISGDTCETCGFLQSTCDEYSPQPVKCAGLYDICVCGSPD